MIFILFKSETKKYITYTITIFINNAKLTLLYISHQMAGRIKFVTSDCKTVLTESNLLSFT